MSWSEVLLRAARARWRNPTRSWPARAVSELRFELATGSMNGVPLDAPIETARVFGPADWLAGLGEDLDLGYSELGLQIESAIPEGGGGPRTFAFLLLFAPEECSLESVRRAFRPARLVLARPGADDFVVGPATTGEDLAAALGPPTETSGDHSLLHTFHVFDLDFVSFHDRGTGRLEEIWISRW